MKAKDDGQARLRTISVLAVLLQGPFDTGNAILGSENLVELMLDMAKSGDTLQEVSDDIFIASSLLFEISVLQWKLLFYQHQKRIKQRVFWLKVLIFSRISLNPKMKKSVYLLLWFDTVVYLSQLLKSRLGSSKNRLK